MSLFLGMFNQVYAQNKYTNNLLIIKALNANNQGDKAIEHYTKLNNNEFNLKKEIGNTYILLKDYKTAANLFLQVNKENKKVGNYELAQCYGQLNKPVFAIKYLKIYLKQNDKETISQIKLNENFAKISNSTEWIECWKQEWYSAIELLYNDADYEYRNGNYNESIEILDNILKKRPSFHQAYYLISQNYYKLQEKSHALYAINEALKIAPTKAEYSYIKSLLLKELGKAKKALKEINYTLKNDSSTIDYYILRAEIYLALKESELAEQEIDLILNYNQSANTNTIAANIYTLNGNYLKALKYYNLSLKNEPNNAKVFVLRGDVYALTKTYEFAEKDYSMALDFFPNRGEIYHKRGVVRVKQKKYKEACSDFSKARDYGYLKSEESLKSYCQ